MNATKTDRMTLVRAANADEIGRFNAVCAVRVVRVDSPGSLNHGERVRYMGSDFDLVTGYPPFTRTWAYANDDRWARLLLQNGIERNPLYAKV